MKREILESLQCSGVTLPARLVEHEVELIVALWSLRLGSVGSGRSGTERHSWVNMMMHLASTSVRLCMCTTPFETAVRYLRLISGMSISKLSTTSRGSIAKIKQFSRASHTGTKSSGNNSKACCSRDCSDQAPPGPMIPSAMAAGSTLSTISSRKGLSTLSYFAFNCMMHDSHIVFEAGAKCEMYSNEV